MEIYSPVSRIIAAYDSGVANRRQREQDKYKKEQDRIKLEQEEKDRQQRIKEFEATHKQLGESMQLQKKAQEARDAYQRFQVTQAVKQAVAEGRMKIPTQEMLKPGSTWAEANPQTEQVYSDYKEPNTGVVIPGAEFQSPVDYRKALAALDLAKQSGEIEAAKQREIARQQEITDRNAEWDRRDAANFKQQNAMFDRQTERMFGMLGARQGGEEDPAATQNKLALIDSGGIQSDTYKGKDRDKLFSLAISQKKFIQPKKFVEESQKLSSNARFIKLIDAVANGDLSSGTSIAKTYADTRALIQQIGTLGAQFPALGRLSDPDIRLLQSGNPTMTSKVISRFLGKAGDVYMKQIVKNLKSSYAGQLKAHFSVVPWKEEKERLVDQYDLYVNGLEGVMR